MADPVSPAPPPPAAPTDSGLLPRTYFKAPRVPLDLRALFLALLGYAVFRVGAELLWLAFDKKYDVVNVFFFRLLGVLNVPYMGKELGEFVGAVFMSDTARGAEGNVWHAIVGGLWTFAVLGFFGQAVHRITSLRIARDEGLPVKDALAFARKNFTTIMLCPLIVAAFVAFLLGCNALAGAVISIPFAVGSILSIVLVPLALISTLLALLLLIGAIVGMPLVSAAAAWERNGSLDALSRAFSYVFARPLQFFWNYFLIILFTAVILIAGMHFMALLVNSIEWGTWLQAPRDVLLSPDRLNLDAISAADWTQKVTAFVLWALLNLVKYGILSTALWWFLGATTSTYADLRCDVDGTEEDEIYLEEDEEGLDAVPPPPAPPPPAAGATPAPPPPAAP
jgi:hypothetical protein